MDDLKRYCRLLSRPAALPPANTAHDLSHKPVSAAVRFMALGIVFVGIRTDNFLKLQIF